MKFICASILVFASASALASEDFRCAETPGTRETICFMKHEVREDVDWHRHAPMYSGGPKLVSPTPYTLAVDCKNETLVMEDRRGVRFAGGLASTTKQSGELYWAMCAVLSSESHGVKKTH
jgi:hypothetical protein